MQLSRGNSRSLPYEDLLALVRCRQPLALKGYHITTLC